MSTVSFDDQFFRSNIELVAWPHLTMANHMLRVRPNNAQSRALERNGPRLEPWLIPTVRSPIESTDAGRSYGLKLLPAWFGSPGLFRNPRRQINQASYVLATLLLPLTRRTVDGARDAAVPEHKLRKTDGIRGPPAEAGPQPRGQQARGSSQLRHSDINAC
jgi:hypothetical protein